jgi:hypothetical protein
MLCMHTGCSSTCPVPATSSHLCPLTPPSLQGTRKDDAQSIEAEVARILAPRTSQPGLSHKVLQHGPSEADKQHTAVEVEQMLVAGRRQEALRAACAGHLWGTAMLLASSMGEKVLAETAATMAQHALMPGTPLRTLAVVMASRADLLQADITARQGPGPGAAPGTAPVSPAYANAGSAGGATFGPNGPSGGSPAFAHMGGGAGFNPMGLLSNWRQNLAILASNRSPGDAELLTKLGERLLVEARQVEAAHACFMLVGLAPGPLGPAREGLLALLGGDHQAQPQLYANVLSLQRTEAYEWARALTPEAAGQGPLHGLLPYRLLYASMLAEAGMVSEALQYCEAVGKVRGAGDSHCWRMAVRSSTASYSCPADHLQLMLQHMHAVVYCRLHPIRLCRCPSFTCLTSSLPCPPPRSGPQEPPPAPQRPPVPAHHGGPACAPARPHPLLRHPDQGLSSWRLPAAPGRRHPQQRPHQAHVGRRRAGAHQSQPQQRCAAPL